METHKHQENLYLNTIPFCLFIFKERELVLSVAVLRVVHLGEDSAGSESAAAQTQEGFKKYEGKK